MAIVIRDTTIVTGDAARTVRHGASIVVDADRIAAVGPVEEVDRRYPDATRVDGRGKAVFPGLVIGRGCANERIAPERACGTRMSPRRPNEPALPE